MGCGNTVARRQQCGGDWLEENYAGTRDFNHSILTLAAAGQFTSRGCMNNCIILGRILIKKIDF